MLASNAPTSVARLMAAIGPDVVSDFGQLDAIPAPAPRGHHPDGSSVQQHSAGSHYPYIVSRRDQDDSVHQLTFYEVHSPSGALVFTAHCPMADAGLRLEVATNAFKAAEKLADKRRADEAYRAAKNAALAR